MIEKEVLGYQNYDWLSSFVLCDLYFATALREFLPDGQSCDPEANSVCAGAANVFSTCDHIDEYGDGMFRLACEHDL